LVAEILIVAPADWGLWPTSPTGRTFEAQWVRNREVVGNLGFCKSSARPRTPVFGYSGRTIEV